MKSSRRTTMSLVGVVVVSGSLVQPRAAATSGEAASDVRAATCAGERATLVGTAGSDQITGTSGRDVVVALAGDDTVLTGRGRDLVCLGDGFDYAGLGLGVDRAIGEEGDDTLNGQQGQDVLAGGPGVDSLTGGAGDDRLRGGSGTSFIVESLLGGAGDDVLVGGPGLDTAQYYSAPGPVHVSLRHGHARGAGNDTLIGIDGVVGSNFADVILGNAAGNGLFGQAGADIIRGGDSGELSDGSSDVISGDQGDDLLYGGAGEDLLTYGRVPRAVSVDLSSGLSTGQGTDRLMGAEGVQGSILNDTLTGGPSADHIAGSLGDDVIDGAGGLDTVIYRDVAGPVEVRLGSGTGRGEAAGSDAVTRVENVWGTNADDDLQGDDGPNLVLGFRGDDRLVGFTGVDLLDGDVGSDTCLDEPDEVVNCESTSEGARSRARPADWPGWLLTSDSD